MLVRRENLKERELTDLTWAVVAINGWNRIAINTRAVPGTYKPTKKAA
jgi:alkylhydroperoxidase family enzyme